jgi:hypothetical protein
VAQDSAKSLHCRFTLFHAISGFMLHCIGLIFIRTRTARACKVILVWLTTTRAFGPLQVGRLHEVGLPMRQHRLRISADDDRLLGLRHHSAALSGVLHCLGRHRERDGQKSTGRAAVGVCRMVYLTTTTTNIPDFLRLGLPTAAWSIQPPPPPSQIFRIFPSF